MSYYVFAVDTNTGDSYVISTHASWAGGVQVGGPFTTRALAQTFINNGGAATGLGNSVLNQYKADIGDWIVVPEGELGDITNALSLSVKNLPGDVIGLIRGDLNTGSGTTYTVTQVTTAQQAENASLAGLVLYPTKAAAQAEANTVNAANNPSQGPNWSSGLAKFLDEITQEGTWIKVAEVTLGILLIVSGLMKLSGASADLSDIAKAGIKYVR
jgi:hypothetical protein